MCNYSACDAGRPPLRDPQPGSSDAGSYRQNSRDDALVLSAMRVLEARLRVPGISLSSPSEVKQYLALRLLKQQHESFVVLFLDTKNRLISADELFRGTLTQTAVYPREVVKTALARNAAAVILAHNHPSGVKEPSQADRLLTATLKQALGLVDVRVLDHVVVAGMALYSFAEHGEL